MVSIYFCFYLNVYLYTDLQVISRLLNLRHFLSPLRMRSKSLQIIPERSALVFQTNIW